MKDKIKNGLIIVLIVLIGLLGLFGGKAVVKYQKEIEELRYNNAALSTQKVLVELQIKFLQDTVKRKDAEIEKLMVIFRAKDKEISGITAELNDALARLTGITNDESYQFLQQIAYNFPGDMSYLFNAFQVKGIHADYLVARNSEKVIPVMTSQLNNAKEQFQIRDSVENVLKRVIKIQKQNLTNCEKINTNNDTIIKDTEKQRDKEMRRKNFWRFTTAVSTGVLIVVSVFGL